MKDRQGRHNYEVSRTLARCSAQS